MSDLSVYPVPGEPLVIQLGIAINDPGAVVPRGRVWGRGGGIEPVKSWQINAINKVLRDHGIDQARTFAPVVPRPLEDAMPQVLFFGERWDAPRVDEAVQVPTPVGQACLRCREKVADGDRGLILATGRLVDGELVSAAEPIHAECDLIGVLGHDVGVCTCTGYDTTTREAARLVWQRVGEQRGRDLGVRADAR